MTSDVMAGANLQGWVIAGMLLFILAFSAICLRVFLTSRSEMQRRALLPLTDGDPVVQTPKPESHHERA